MSHVIRRLEYKDIDIVDYPGEEQISPEAAKDIIDSAAKYGCTREGEWFSYKRTNAQRLRCGGWVGTLQVGGKQIEVRPKIEDETGADTTVDLVELLIRSGNIEAEFREVAHLANRLTAFELLALWYARRISRECNRGLSRAYMEVNDDIPGKRGRIDFSKQWLNKARKRRLVSCSFDEHTEDNRLNRILKAGLRAALAAGPIAAECRHAISNSLKLLEGIADVKFTAEAARTFKPDRKDARFRPLLRLAANFIADRHQDLRAGKADKGEAGLSLMWSAWRLFESYVYRELSGENAGSKFKLPAGWRIKNQVSGRHMIRRKGEGDEGRDEFGYILKPDIIIYDPSGVEAIICDTKWKYEKYDNRDVEVADATRIKGKNGRYVVKKADLYQMFAYSRYYARNGTPPSIALIYPTQKPLGKTGKANGPLSMLTIVDTLFFNLGEDKATQTRIDIYEFPVPTSTESIPEDYASHTS